MRGVSKFVQEIDAMVAFIVSVNGKRCCTMGASSFMSLLEARVGWLGPRNSFDLHATGIEGNECMTWPVHSIEMGDKITIEITETDQIDEPFDRYQINPHE
jgi:hypothetical protein